MWARSGCCGVDRENVGWVWVAVGWGGGGGVSGGNGFCRAYGVGGGCCGINGGCYGGGCGVEGVGRWCLGAAVRWVGVTVG